MDYLSMSDEALIEASTLQRQAAAAMGTTLADLYPEQMAQLRTQMAARFETVPQIATTDAEYNAYDFGDYEGQKND